MNCLFYRPFRTHQGRRLRFVATSDLDEVGSATMYVVWPAMVMVQLEVPRQAVCQAEVLVESLQLGPEQ